MAQQGKFNAEIPRFTGNSEERWRQLEDYIYRLEENLKFALGRLEEKLKEAEKKE